MRITEFTSGAAIHARSLLDPPVALASRSHGDAETTAFLDEIGVNDCRTVGSSLKFCLGCGGRGGCLSALRPHHGMGYGRGGRGAACRRGSTVLPDGSPLTYGKRGRSDAIDFANPAFIAGAVADHTATECLPCHDPKYWSKPEAMVRTNLWPSPPP